MKEHRDEKGNLVAIETNEAKPVDIPPAQLRYVSPCSDRRFVADLCIKEGDDYVRFALNRNQALNMIEELQKLVRAFDKHTPEDTYNG
jgi:hypothetical protein